MVPNNKNAKNIFQWSVRLYFYTKDSY